jgi:hypothetical protein
MARVFAERGWSLDVVLVSTEHMESVDMSRMADVPPGTRLFTVPHSELPITRVQRVLVDLYRRLRARRPAPAALAAEVSSLHREELRSSIGGRQALRRAYLAWLHYAFYRQWARAAAEEALRIYEPGVHEAVVTSGPPHMTHEAGVIVARRTGLPLVIDLRDPWSLRHRLEADIASPVAYRLADRYEARAVAAADLIVLNTELLLKGMQKKYPDAAGRMITAMNGADWEPLPPHRHTERFTIAFAGTIYVDRDPRTLFRGARKVIDELGLTPADIGLDFIGYVGGPGGVSTAEMARQEGLEGFVTVGGVRPRREALEFLAGAQVLVSLPQDGTLQIPAKIFDYMNFPAWMLVFGEEGSAPDLLLRGTDADFVRLDDVEGTAAVIRRRYLQYRRGERPTPVNADGRFSRESQAHILVDAIEQRVVAGESKE